MKSILSSKGIVLFILMLIVPFFSGNSQDIIFGMIFIMSCYIFCIELQKKDFKISSKKNNTTFKILIISSIFIIYSLINIVINGVSYNSIVRIVQLYTCFFVLIASSMYNWKKRDRCCFFINKDSDFCIYAVMAIIWI